MTFTLVEIGRDLDGLENRAVRAALQLMAKMRVGAVQAVMSGRLPAFDVASEDVVELLRDAAMLAHLRAFKRSVVDDPAPDGMDALRLSMFDEQLEAIRKLMGLDTDQINALQRKYHTNALRVVNGVSQVVEQELRRQVLGLLEEGVTRGQAVKRLRKAFQSAGVDAGGDHRIATIFRTQAQIAYNAGRWDADQSGATDTFWGYRYYTKKDERVRPIHQALHGMTLPKEHPLWLNFWPPNGWNCRCWVKKLKREAKVKLPPEQLADGTTVLPDVGFDTNFGVVLSRTTVYMNGLMLANYDPNQPRDDAGMWNESGSSDKGKKGKGGAGSGKLADQATVESYVTKLTKKFGGSTQKKYVNENYEKLVHELRAPKSVLQALEKKYKAEYKKAGKTYNKSPTLDNQRAVFDASDKWDLVGFALDLYKEGIVKPPDETAPAVKPAGAKKQAPKKPAPAPEPPAPPESAAPGAGEKLTIDAARELIDTSLTDLANHSGKTFKVNLAKKLIEGGMTQSELKKLKDQMEKTYDKAAAKARKTKSDADADAAALAVRRFAVASHAWEQYEYLQKKVAPRKTHVDVDLNAPLRGLPEKASDAGAKIRLTPKAVADTRHNIAQTDAHYKEWHDSLSDKHKAALEQYMGAEYQDMHDVMRACPPTYKCGPKELKTGIDDLKDALSSAPPPPANLTVYRGLNLHPDDSYTLTQQMTKAMRDGKSVSFDTFTSTSLSIGVAESFTDNKNDVLFQIKPKTGAWVSKVSDLDPDAGEAEFLQAPGVKYRVTGMDRVRVYYRQGDYFTRTRIKLEEL